MKCNGNGLEYPVPQDKNVQDDLLLAGIANLHLQRSSCSKQYRHSRGRHSKVVKLKQRDRSMNVNTSSRQGLLWGSIALAVFTSLIQGLATTVVSVAEDQSMWTWRFRLALYEHWWWTVISAFLSVAFSLIVLSFLTGNNNESVGVLALSTATAIAIVNYAVPAWRSRSFIGNRWLAWTGSSRTGIARTNGPVCRDREQWQKLKRLSSVNSSAPPSDHQGWGLWGPTGLIEDPTAVLNGLPRAGADFKIEGRDIGLCVYDDGFPGPQLSLLWGSSCGFEPRCSRVINSASGPWLRSRPTTFDGYAAEGVCLACGVLGRTKGLRPQLLVADFDDVWKTSRGIRRSSTVRIIAELENESTWKPRPSKAMRNTYRKIMEDQFGGISPAFAAVATELALIMLDTHPSTLSEWLSQGLEQQDLVLNIFLSRPAKVGFPQSPRAADEELSTLYKAHYVSTLLSINFWNPDFPDDMGKRVRPDLICFALLRLVEGAVADGATAINCPTWWTQQWVRERLTAERKSLKGGWENSAAWLLGLAEFPDALWDFGQWPDVRYKL